MFYCSRVSKDFDVKINVYLGCKDMLYIFFSQKTNYLEHLKLHSKTTSSASTKPQLVNVQKRLPSLAVFKRQCIQRVIRQTKQLGGCSACSIGFHSAKDMKLHLVGANFIFLIFLNTFFPSLSNSLRALSHFCLSVYISSGRDSYVLR